MDIYKHMGGGRRMALRYFSESTILLPLKRTAVYYYCLSTVQQVAHKNGNDC